MAKQRLALGLLMIVSLVLMFAGDTSPDRQGPAVAAEAPTVVAQQAAGPGDVDCDGSVDAVDALQILRSVAGLPVSAECLNTSGDVNCSGAVDAVDALLDLRYVAGLVTELEGCADHFTYTIDPSLVPSQPELPGLSGGPPRPVGVVEGPEGSRDEFVVNEIVFHPQGQDDLNAFLERYGGTVLRDGMPRLLEGTEPPPGLPETTGWYLIRVDLGLSSLEDFAPNMEAAGAQGHAVFSSEDAARLTALVAREGEQELGPNFIMSGDQCRICEHPDYGGGHLDAAEWWWMTEDDDLTTAGDQGISVGVVHAWEYVKYMGYPAVGVPYIPVIVAIIDGGFDLDETTGAPLNGNVDYFYMGSKPKQLDEVDGDSTAGGTNPNNCSGGSPCPWHGQKVFGAALARARNDFGSAGTAGGADGVYPLLIKTDGDRYTTATGIYNAIYNGADVINMSLGAECGWACHNIGSGNVVEAAVKSARNMDVIVVASAGNDGKDISNVNYRPCKINGAVCVGAMGSTGQAHSYSNYGSGVDIWAPAGIRSTVTRDSADCATCDTDNLGIDELPEFYGTSASSPFVAGVVALMKMLNRSITYDQVRSILASTANAGADAKVTPGYVDAYRALAQVKVNQPPTVTITSPANGASTSYQNVSFWAEVLDPETPTPLGGWADFSSTVVFSSDRDGQLCTDSGDATGGGTTLSCTVPLMSLGTHVITATATDPFGATTSASSISINVVNTPPTATITYPASGSTFYTSQQINLRGYGFDPDETIPDANLVWTLKLGPQLWMLLGGGPDIWVSLAAGTHTIELTATDSLGATGTDSITINVQVGAGYPTAQIISPADNYTVGLGTQITFQGSGSDPEDETLPGSSLQWYSDIDEFLGTGNVIQKVLSGQTCQQTLHTITLQVTDSDGHQASHSITVKVLDVC